MHLYITYKRYSSWSLRPWLAMKVAGIPFTDTVLPYAHDDSLLKFSEQHEVPATVPVLEYRGQMIWDSLAILEFLADTYPEKQLWPANPALRALARSACAEMHCGFSALRTEHPMNCHRIHAIAPSHAVQQDLNRLAVIWQHFANAKNLNEKSTRGEFLCGEFCIADAMFAPIAWRATGYQLQISKAFDRWSKAIMALPAMDVWVKEGGDETWRVEETENRGI